MATASTWFTPRSARRTLQEIRPLAEKASRIYRELERNRREAICGDQPVCPRYFMLLQALTKRLDGLRARGVRVEELARGELGFPARRAGRPVLLSWRVGEVRLDHWHEPGSAERRPLDDDGPWEAMRSSESGKPG
jgi:hypothetical protein